MRHRRDYADISGLQGQPSTVGFLGTPRIGSGIGPLTILMAIALLGFSIGAGIKGIAWPLG